jgi:heme/copper-type cytochrome/quinol oxidase subunit 4
MKVVIIIFVVIIVIIVVFQSYTLMSANKTEEQKLKFQ